MLDYYAPPDDRKPVDLALARARTWLQSVQRKHHEDRVFGLWGAALLKEPEDTRSALRQELLATQRADGSWAQEPEMDGDAYATGQAVFALAETGLSPGDPALVRAAEFLVKTQEPDGSWHVKTRSKPIQVYFDNGDPHGKDQFISTPASAWAIAGLSRLCRPE
jgi:N-acyl-D-amino-acid deacylase